MVVAVLNYSEGIFVRFFRKIPYLGPGTNLNFFKVEPGTDCILKSLQKIFRFKNMVFGPIKIPKTFLNFFLRFLGVLVPVRNVKNLIFILQIPEDTVFSTRNYLRF